MEGNRRCAGSHRFSVRLPALVEPVGAEGSLSAGFAKNLSRRGMLLRSRQKIAAGSVVRLTLLFRFRLSFTVTGRVQWVRPGGEVGWDLGIQFGKALADQLIASIATEELPSAVARA